MGKKFMRGRGDFPLWLKPRLEPEPEPETSFNIRGPVLLLTACTIHPHISVPQIFCRLLYSGWDVNPSLLTFPLLK